MARHFDKTTVEYTQAEIQRAMEAWAATHDTKERIKMWFTYVDHRDSLPVGTAYTRYIATLRPVEALDHCDA